MKHNYENTIEFVIFKLNDLYDIGQANDESQSYQNHINTLIKQLCDLKRDINEVQARELMKINPVITSDQMKALELGYSNAMEWLTWDFVDYCEQCGIPEGAELGDSIDKVVTSRVKEFVKSLTPELIERYLEEYKGPEMHAFEAMGHDLYLTSHRHGSGFWDRGHGSLGVDLTDIAETVAKVDIYAGSNGKVEAE